MVAQLFQDNVEVLRPIAEAWEQEMRANAFGIIANDMNKYLAGLDELSHSNDADLLVLYDDSVPVGYIGLQYFDSPLGKQRMANEHFFYVIPEKRGMASMRLMRLAKQVAKAKGCSHIIFNASNLASDLHDKVCKLYERIGMKKFETSFISEV